ncbi:DoxX family protein [Winogradskyella alexanderae]|uniref:DoxX family protein n=1 Tax=Winogradskyella alexanderae TaxID=2877123 RepID=A0ABS7XSQ4_9FLAO|nr:hypothetical protein [Winogradskyella alexanderae]MCA0132066.1 hypothetical protein [Winogradskyella alexanderae]
MNEPLSIYFMAALYIIAGIMHFVKTKMYMLIMPEYLSNHRGLVILSGIIEILLGIGLCIPALKVFSIYSIIAMLAVFLLVHFYMLTNEKASLGIPKWILILRIPLQFALMYWAWIYI